MTLPTFLSIGCASVLAAPLAYAGVAKLLDEQAFVTHLSKFGLAGGVGVVRAIGLGELAAASVLVLWSTALGSVPAAFAYATFGFVMARAVRAGAGGDCGCFGALPSVIDGLAVARNGALAMGALAVGALRAGDVLVMYDLGTAARALILLVLLLTAVEVFLEIRAHSTAHTKSAVDSRHRVSPSRDSHDG